MLFLADAPANLTAWDTIYDAMIIAVCVILLITAVAILRSAFGRSSGGEVGGWELSGAWRRVRAVARITLAEGIRMKIAVVFVILLAVTLPALCLAARGDGTVRGQVQMYLGYSVGLTGFYLSLLTIFFSAKTLSSEIASRQIYGLVSKPIPRWQIVFGKWLGVTMLNVGLVAAAMCITYAGARWIVYRFQRELKAELMNRGGLAEPQARACIDAISDIRGVGGKGESSPIIPAMASALGYSREQVVQLLRELPEATRMNLRRLDEVRRQVLTARASVRPTYPDLTQRIEERYAELKKAGELPQAPEWTPDRIRGQIRALLMRDYTAVAPLDVREWEMKGPPVNPDEEFLLSVRYKIAANIYSPEIRMQDGTTLAENTFFGQWVVGDPSSTNYYLWPAEPLAEAVNAFHEFEVPTRCIAPDGTVKVMLRNSDPRRFEIVIPPQDGLEVLYKVGSFEENCVKIGLALLIPLGLLAAFGVMMSTFCTFPVAAMVALALYLIALSQGFIAESLSLSHDLMPDYMTTREELRKFATEAMFSAVSLGNIDAAGLLIEGRALLWSELGWTAATILGLRAIPVLLIGVLVFRRRELAAIIV